MRVLRSIRGGLQTHWYDTGPIYTILVHMCGVHRLFILQPVLKLFWHDYQGSSLTASEYGLSKPIQLIWTLRVFDEVMQQVFSDNCTRVDYYPFFYHYLALVYYLIPILFTPTAYITSLGPINLHNLSCSYLLTCICMTQNSYYFCCDCILQVS